MFHHILQYLNLIALTFLRFTSFDLHNRVSQVVAKLIRSTAVSVLEESNDKGDGKSSSAPNVDVGGEVLTPKSSRAEIERAMNDSHNSLVFSLENRTSRLRALVSSSSLVRWGFEYPPTTTDPQPSEDRHEIMFYGFDSL